MKYLFKEFNKLIVGGGRPSVIFLDYDGTLSPIARTPDEARTTRHAIDILRELSKDPITKVSVVSGRALRNIKNRISLKSIIYVGNHGMEIEGPEFKHVLKLSNTYKIIKRKIRADIRSRTRGIKGILIEDKGFTLAIHYRLVNKKDALYVKSAFSRAIAPYKVKGIISVGKGKKIYEIRPNIDWDKGKAVMWILKKMIAKPSDAVYIGDDVTDEDAFKVLNNNGLTIFVGKPKRSYAKYYLRNISEVIKFLKRIIE